MHLMPLSVVGVQGRGVVVPGHDSIKGGLRGLSSQDPRRDGGMAQMLERLPNYLVRL
jgi:hypothetical protein